MVNAFFGLFSSVDLWRGNYPDETNDIAHTFRIVIQRDDKT